MTEFKFRGKTEVGKLLVCGNLLQNEEGTFIVSTFKIECCDNETADLFATAWDKVIPSTIGQYTGAQDNNKNDLYVGDIFETWYKSALDGKEKISRYEIIFQNYCFMAKCLTKSYEESFPLFMVLRNDYNVELIGNVYNNQELLETQQNDR